MKMLISCFGTKIKSCKTIYVIFDQLMTFLTDNKLFCMEQFGFRPGHSTELAALRLVDHLTTEMDNSNVPTNIYILTSRKPLTV